MPKDLRGMLNGAQNFEADIRPWVIEENDAVDDMLDGSGLVDNQLYGFDSGTPQVNEFNKPICFNKGTKILCYKDGKERYIPVESLVKGILVKTYKHGYRPIQLMKSNIYQLNSNSDMAMYKMKKRGSMIADLEMTGYHAILVNKDDPKHCKDIANQSENFTEWPDQSMFIENKYRLRSAFSSEFTKMQTKYYTIYTFTIEGEEEQYGIWANGLLVESTSKRIMKQEKSSIKKHQSPKVSPNIQKNNLQPSFLTVFKKLTPNLKIDDRNAVENIIKKLSIINPSKYSNKVAK